MGKIYIPPRINNIYGKSIASSKSPMDFIHLVGMNISDVIMFNDGTDSLLDEGRLILPRHYYLFVGTFNGELQYKPYEYDQYRIVVSTYNNIIYTIDSIG